MSLETTVKVGTLERRDLQHFSGTYEGKWSFEGTTFVHYVGGVAQEQSVGISLQAAAAMGPDEAKLVIEVTRKAINKLGTLGAPTMEAHYTGPIYDKPALLNGPTHDVLHNFRTYIAPAVDQRLKEMGLANDVRLNLNN